MRAVLTPPALDRPIVDAAFLANPYPAYHALREAGPIHWSPLDPFEFVRTIAAARITMPVARVRLSAGRQQMGEAVQALCFLPGANFIFYGDKLLTTGNPDTQADLDLLPRLGLKQGQPEPRSSVSGIDRRFEAAVPIPSVCSA